MAGKSELLNNLRQLYYKSQGSQNGSQLERFSETCKLRAKICTLSCGFTVG